MTAPEGAGLGRNTPPPSPAQGAYVEHSGERQCQKNSSGWFVSEGSISHHWAAGRRGNLVRNTVLFCQRAVGLFGRSRSFVLSRNRRADSRRSRPGMWQMECLQIQRGQTKEHVVTRSTKFSEFNCGSQARALTDSNGSQFSAEVDVQYRIHFQVSAIKE